MATILPFNEVSSNISNNPAFKKVLIDTCTLISFSHETNEFNTETVDLIETLKRNKVLACTNVNIRSEFIDFHRRLILTEALTILSQQTKGIMSYTDVAKKLKAHKTNVEKRANADNPLVLNDSAIKQFKKLLSFKHLDTENVWLKFCKDNLQGHLEHTFEIIKRVLKLKYLSLRKGEEISDITNDVSWNGMFDISEKSGLGINDSMILNMFNSTNIPILITTDYDLVYAGAISDDSKLIFCPESFYLNHIRQTPN